MALALFASLLTLAVILLGAYTRLGDAGLGCPDWPVCYGKLIVPHTKNALTQAQQVFPNAPLIAKKAWTEMVHRYFAGTLGLVIFGLALWALWRRREFKTQPLLVPLLLLGVVIFQALLGMWTVTLKLLPVVVMGHLLGGMALIALLWWLTLSSRQKQPTYQHRVKALKPWALIALLIVIAQIALGAWTSTNYAALACPTFPFCYGSLTPHMEWRAAFNFLSPIGPNYEGGHLAMGARVTIQMMHRYGAFFTAAYLTPFALALLCIREFSPLRKMGWLILAALATQVTLGILNILLTLPMWTAVAHTGVAALLLITLITTIYKIFTSRQGGIL